MGVWFGIVVCAMTLVIIILIVKIYMLQKGAKEIAEEFSDRLATDTNTLIDISCNDKYMRQLANTLNVELRRLRMQRHRFVQGDAELKNAVTNISHDLRTPLTAICGYLDLLEREEKSKNVERYIEIIRNRSEMLIQLTEELFRYSVIISEDKSEDEAPVAINSVLEESIAAFYSNLNERGIVPNIQMPQKNVVRKIDRFALSRVFSNLLNNAIKYSDGDLDIVLLENGTVMFTNTASELNEVQVGKLFDRFYTVEAARKSTGLGLAIARTLVEQMNGTISAKYVEKKLTVSISLPEC